MSHTQHSIDPELEFALQSTDHQLGDFSRTQVQQDPGIEPGETPRAVVIKNMATWLRRYVKYLRNKKKNILLAY